MQYPQQFKQLLKNIKQLKIQGATNVALAGKEALTLIIKDILKKKIKNKSLIKQTITEATVLIISTRPTEPLLRNVLIFLTQNLSYDSLYDLQKSYFHAVHHLDLWFKEAKQQLFEYAANKIKNGMIIYTHCHSSTVVQSLLLAKKQGKRFIVHNTETRPLYQGRITAKELAKAGIPVEHFVDSGAKLALKDADLIFLGADALTVDGIYNKIGSDMIAYLAHFYDIPVYVLSLSWKYDVAGEFGFEEIIEQRHVKEVWQRPPKNVHINNYAFEKIHYNFVHGIISELGVLPPQMFFEHVHHHYPFFEQQKMKKRKRFFFSSCC